MIPIETIEKVVNDVRVIGELFDKNILESESDSMKARIVFVKKDTKHLIGAIYLKGVEDKDKLQEAVDGAVDKINDILPCL